MRKKILNCAFCKKDFWYPNCSHYKYCSRVCYYAARPLLLLSLKCEQCGKEFKRTPHQQTRVVKRKATYCSYECVRLACVGEKAPNYIDGRDKEGYRFAYISEDGKRKRRQVHVLIAETVLGRRLKAGEVVHHINGQKNDNRNSNLLICDRSYHSWLHHRMGQLYMQDKFPN